MYLHSCHTCFCDLKYFSDFYLILIFYRSYDSYLCQYVKGENSYLKSLQIQNVNSLCLNLRE